MTSVPPIATFRTGFAASKHAICLSASMDAFDPTEPYSRTVIFNERFPDVWTFSEHDMLIPALCTWRDPASPQARYFVALGEDGEVVVLSPDPIRERIADAGLPDGTSRKYGYLNDIRQIGSRLYACGYAGQVYRRNGSDEWVHLDRGLLQDPGSTDPAYFVQVINGPDERMIYAAGSEDVAGYPPRADCWDGDQWTRLELPVTAGRITDIFVETNTRIWMCGAKGTLLLGNAFDGFRTMNPLGDHKLFYSVVKFNDLMYLGSNLGLFQFDPQRPQSAFRKVRTGLVPELVDANVVHAVDDVLWSIGPKDIARFDGVRWERIEDPDNVPIGQGADAAGAG